MIHPKNRLARSPRVVVALAILLSLALSLVLAGTAAAQRSVPVTIDNTDLDPVRVRQSIQPINADTTVALTGSLINAPASELYVVPADSRLVIESISFWTFTTTCSFLLTPTISTVAGGEHSEFRLNTPSRTYASAGWYLHNMTQSLRLYADPGTSVWVDMLRTVGGCGVTARFSITGHLVPID